MKLPQLFEDDRILVVNKPSGLPSHTLDESMPSCESLLKLERPNESWFLGHRLDTGTSGVLVFAKSQSAFDELREQFKLKKIQKHYVAWSEKTLDRTTKIAQIKLPYRIDWNLAHHPKSKKRMIAIPPEKHRHFRGKPIPALSILHEITEDTFQGIRAFRFDLEIVTGVMHQIRVHLDSIGFPLIGDTIYEKSERQDEPRLALHARKIVFELGGHRYEVETNWPRTLHLPPLKPGYDNSHK